MSPSPKFVYTGTVDTEWEGGGDDSGGRKGREGRMGRSWSWLCKSAWVFSANHGAFLVNAELVES